MITVKLNLNLAIIEYLMDKNVSNSEPIINATLKYCKHHSIVKIKESKKNNKEHLNLAASKFVFSFNHQ